MHGQPHVRFTYMLGQTRGHRSTNRHVLYGTDRGLLATIIQEGWEEGGVQALLQVPDIS